MEYICQLIYTVQSFIWGKPLLLLIIGTGIYFTIVLKGMQIRYLWRACCEAFQQEKLKAIGDISPMQAVMTSMASAVGTGSIVGMSTAVHIGGMGTVFWMWVAAFLLLPIKYAEALLSVQYRIKDRRGEMAGGPMYYIEHGLGWKWLAVIFAFLGTIATSGTGNVVQANSIAAAINSIYPVDPIWIGIGLSILTAVVLFGGVKSIGRVSAILVPFMAILYVTGGIIVILCCRQQLPIVLSSIFTSAFTPEAAAGGFLGTAAMMALQLGVSRSVLTSEAGMGISSIAAAAAKTESSGIQAMISMGVTIFSTTLICTITALVISVTQVLGASQENGQLLSGASLAIEAFNSAVYGGKYIVIIGLILFAYSTVVAWAYYGEKCIEYLLGRKAIVFYRCVFALLVIPGAMFELNAVWSFADIMNALMVIPNLIALLAMSPIIKDQTKIFVQSLYKRKSQANLVANGLLVE